jgi:hypothetical protein
MPYSMIPPALGFCFVFVWAFIAGMIVREGLLAIRREREEIAPGLALRRRCAAQGGMLSLR